MRRLPRVIAAAAILAGALLLGRGVALDEDIARLLPDTDPELRRATLLLRRVLERSVVDIGAAEGAVVPVEVLGAGADRFAESLLSSGTVASVRARVAETEALPIVDLLRDHAARLIDAAMLSRIEEQLAPEAVTRTVHALARRLQEPDGAYLAGRAARDPLGFSDLALGPLASLGSGMQGARLVDGRLMSADGRHVMVFVDPGFPATDTARTSAFLDAVDEAAAGLRDDGIRVAHIGSHRSTFDNARQIERDVKLTSGLGVLLVGLIAVVVFGRPLAALLALLPALFGGAVAFGIFALFRDSIAAAVAGFAAVLLGVTIDYAVHVIYPQLRGHGPQGVPVRAILMGAATTGVAFLSLRASSLPGVREIGTMGAIGIGAAALFAVLVLPAIVRKPRRERAPLLGLARALRSTPVARGLLLAGVLITPLLAVGASRVSFEGDVRRLSALSAAADRDEAALREVWGRAFRVSTLLVRGPDRESALLANDRLAVLLDGWVEEGLVDGASSLSGLLPARVTQAARLAAWRAFWTEERLSGLRASLEQAVAETPFRPDAFEAFFDWVAREPGPLTAEKLGEGALGEFVADRILRDAEGGCLVATPLLIEDFERVEALARRLDEESPETLLVNREVLVRRLADLVGSETWRLAWVAFLAVGLVVTLWTGRLELAAVVLPPLLLSCLWTFGVLGWLGIRINLANAVFVAFLFGLAVDYAIFLTHGRLERLRSGHDREAEMDASVLLCALTTCAGFGVLSLAGHPVLHTIGVTALIGILSAALATLVFVPLLGAWLLRRGAPRRDGSRWHRDAARRFRWAGPYLSHYAASKMKRDPFVRALPELCPGSGEILVAGCGHGIATTRLALAFPGRPILAVDSDERKVRTARGAVGDLEWVRFVVGDLRDVDLGRPETALAIDLLHYWPEDVQRELLSRIADALPPGGTLVFREGCRDGRGHRLVHVGEAFARRTGFTRAGRTLHFQTREGWLGLMAGCGLSVVSEHPEFGLFSNLLLVCRKEGAAWSSSSKS